MIAFRLGRFFARRTVIAVKTDGFVVGATLVVALLAQVRNSYLNKES